MLRKCWLVYDSAQAERNLDYIEKYRQSAERRNVDLELIITEELQSGFSDSRPWLWYQGNECQLPDFVINRASQPFLSYHLEAMSLPVFNRADISAICLDKRKSYHAAAKASLPVMPSRFYRGCLPDWNTIRQDFADMPLVIKPSDGRSGRNVLLIKSETDYEQAITVFEHGQDIIVQQAASDLGLDLRVYVIGRHIEAAMLRKSDPERDFRSNYNLGGEASTYNLNHHEKSMIMRLVDQLDPGLIGIDFIFDGGRPVFNEIEDAVGARMLYTLTDIDIADRYIEYILRRIERQWLPGS
jgi:ribosomal protein S6--L-glutamate ligase/gamma-F420-2:alpha-L-glutamate ligase